MAESGGGSAERGERRPDELLPTVIALGVWAF